MLRNVAATSSLLGVWGKLITMPPDEPFERVSAVMSQARDIPITFCPKRMLFDQAWVLPAFYETFFLCTPW